MEQIGGNESHPHSWRFVSADLLHPAAPLRGARRIARYSFAALASSALIVLLGVLGALRVPFQA